VESARVQEESSRIGAWETLVLVLVLVFDTARVVERTTRREIWISTVLVWCETFHVEQI
jgi:predicted membrane protein